MASRRHPEGGKPTSRRGFLSYLKFFLGDTKIAAITPSSRYLVGKVMAAAGVSGARAVIEYGAGTGVMTQKILDHMSSEGRLLAVEFNEHLYARAKRSIADPRATVIQGDIRRIDELARAHGMEQVDCIISGIPFAFLSRRERGEVLDKTSRLLRPGGRFVAYQVTTHLVSPLKSYFARTKIQWEMRNIPPHFVLTAFKGTGKGA